ncbi:MAG TPA: class I SAM-dependent methyltransferase [Gaiellaceae bacterium]|nr:class I SAM-dependent methyltransferase [Gaiellaceae bacterium]
MKAYYEARAREYDDWWLGRGLYAGNRPDDWHDEREQLTRWISELPPARTLDVACGTGFLTRHLHGEVVGLDQSASMLEVASAQAPHVEFVQGDALELPFDDDSFDRIFASYFYCHLEDDDRRRFLAEVRRVAPELVVVGTVLREGEEPTRWDERMLRDGSRWKVFKRVFVPDELAAELGGRVLHVSRLFVMVASP